MILVTKLLYWAKELILTFRRSPTLGARAIVLRGPDVLLVRLTYYAGWFLPGGGVDRGESFEGAMKRELLEECGIESKRAKLFGLYLNKRGNKVDHVGIYVVTDFEGEPRMVDPKEIAEVKFFSLEDLPDELWSGHRKRIEEYLGKRA